LENLVYQLKAEKRNSSLLLRGIINEYTTSAIDFFCKRGICLGAYLFLDNHGRIIPYTPELLKILEINEDIKGRKYYSFLKLKTELKLKEC